MADTDFTQLLHWLKAGNARQFSKNLIEADMPWAEKNNFLRNALAMLWDQQEDVELEKVTQHFPTQSPLAYYPHVFRARLQALRGDYQGCAFYFRKALRSAQELYKLSEMRGELVPASTLQQTILIDPECLQEIMAETDRPLSPQGLPVLATEPVTSRPPENARGLIVLTSCNRAYFDRFATGFLASTATLDSETWTHVHLMNSGLKVESQIFKDLISEYRKICPRLSISLEETPTKITYYACRRFQIAPQVLSLYPQSQLIISDIDVSLRPSVLEIFKDPSFDGGLFEIPRTGPMLTCHCSISAFRNSTQTQQFLSLLAHYLERLLKEAEDLWTIDQCALFVLSRAALNADLPMAFKWVDLQGILNRNLQDFQINQGLDDQTLSEEKTALRGSSPGQRQVEIFWKPDGRPALRTTVT